MIKSEPNDLENYFYNNKNNRLVSKWFHYFDIYERYFSRYRNQPVSILEIGIYHGGSLQMWKDYFGDKVKVYGIDIDPKCKAFEEENISIFIGSQSDREFLRELKTQIPPVDIILDDGGHTMEQQRVSFEELFDHVKEDGIYICEDTHTSYWPDHGGGYRRRGTFVEYSKNLIECLNIWHIKRCKVDDFSRSLYSISFYDSIIVFEKRPREKPEYLEIGVPSWKKEQEADKPFLEKVLDKLREYKLRLLNKWYS